MTSTARKLAEEVVGKAEAELTHVPPVMTVGELIAALAHEINQSLAAIVSNADVRNLNEQPRREQ